LMRLRFYFWPMAAAGCWSSGINFRGCSSVYSRQACVLRCWCLDLLCNVCHRKVSMLTWFVRAAMKIAACERRFASFRIHFVYFM